MAFGIEAACGCFSGTSREQNQDNFYFKRKHLSCKNNGLKSPLKYRGTTDEVVLFAVFDGLGGGARGEEASFLASEVFASEIKKLDELVVENKEFLIKTCTLASEKIYELSKEKQLGTMGTTVAALLFLQDEVYSCNVGDSKVFRIREGKMLQISEDHTDAKLLSQMGLDKKPVLLQYLGISKTDMKIDPYISKGDIKTGDYYLVCSDGVTDAIPLEKLYDSVKSLKKPNEIVNYVLSCVAKSNGNDNSTLIVANVL